MGIQIICMQSKQINMAYAIIITRMMVFLYLISISKAMRNLDLINNQDDSMASPVNEVGICSLLIETRGYMCEEHKVITKDGYILSVQRIPAGRNGVKADKPPVLLQHGIFVDGRTWVFNPPNQSLGFILADNGYDVWIANTRGTSFSRAHISLSPNDPFYWEWSWDELVMYEFPALVQFVHDQTGQNIHYAAHSLGTLVAFAAFSKGQTLNLLRSAVMLSPIAYLGDVSSLVARFAADAFLGEDIYWLGVREFDPRVKVVLDFLSDICKRPENRCSDLLTSLTGPNCCLNSSKTDNFLENEPQATSTKNLIHLAQNLRDGNIAMYDYGNAYDNQKHYGQFTPPIYDIRRIPNDFPIHLSYGGVDKLSNVQDVNILLESFKDHDPHKLVVQYKEHYAHADFILAMNANEVVYDPVMTFLKLH